MEIKLDAEALATVVGNAIGLWLSGQAQDAGGR